MITHIIVNSTAAYNSSKVSILVLSKNIQWKLLLKSFSPAFFLLRNRSKAIYLHVIFYDVSSSPLVLNSYKIDGHTIIDFLKLERHHGSFHPEKLCNARTWFL
jgi:hypothetical protein